MHDTEGVIGGVVIIHAFCLLALWKLLPTYCIKISEPINSTPKIWSLVLMLQPKDMTKLVDNCVLSVVFLCVLEIQCQLCSLLVKDTVAKSSSDWSSLLCVTWEKQEVEVMGVFSYAWERKCFGPSIEAICQFLLGWVLSKIATNLKDTFVCGY